MRIRAPCLHRISYDLEPNAKPEAVWGGVGKSAAAAGALCGPAPRTVAVVLRAGKPSTALLLSALMPRNLRIVEHWVKPCALD